VSACGAVPSVDVRAAQRRKKLVGGKCNGEFVNMILQRNNPMRTAGEASVSGSRSSKVQTPAEGLLLAGQLEVPGSSVGIVLFAPRRGRGRHSLRNQAVARMLRSRGAGSRFIGRCVTLGRVILGPARGAPWLWWRLRHAASES